MLQTCTTKIYPKCTLNSTISCTSEFHHESHLENFKITILQSRRKNFLMKSHSSCTFRYSLKYTLSSASSAFKTMSSSINHRKDLQLSVSNNEIKNVLKDPYFIAGSDFTNNSGINGFDVCNISNLCIIMKHSLAKFFLLS